MIHRRSKKRKPRSKETSHKRVRRNGTICIQQVYVDYVFEALYEDHKHSATYWNRANDLCRPRCAGMTRPCEPEEAAGEDYSLHDHRRKTAFGHNLSGCAGCLAGENCEGVGDGCNEAENDADEEGDECEGGLAGGLVAVLDEGDGEAFEEEEEHAVEEGLVEGYEDEDGFGG